MMVRKVIKEEREMVKKKMEDGYDSIDNPIKTVPGIRPVTASTVIVKIGDIKRFWSAPLNSRPPIYKF
ncbi:MAG: transposase [Thermoplasmatales archaeon]